MIVATTNDLPGYRIVRVIGLVRGITVRSRSIVGTIGGALQSIVVAILRSSPRWRRPPARRRWI